MQVYDPLLKEQKTVREPVCSRGGEVTANSVTGTGPGSACRLPPSPPTPAAPPPPLACRITVRSAAPVRYRTGGGGASRIVC